MRHITSPQKLLSEKESSLNLWLNCLNNCWDTTKKYCEAVNQISIIFNFVSRGVFACTLVNIITLSRTNTASFVQKFGHSGSAAVQRVALKVGFCYELVAKKLSPGLTRGANFSNFCLICISQVYLGSGIFSIWKGSKWIWIWLDLAPRGSGDFIAICNLAASPICICTQTCHVLIPFWEF